MLSHFSFVWLFVTPWIVAHRVPLTWDSPGKNTGVGCHALPQGIFWPRDWTRVSFVSCIGWWFLYHEYHLGSPSPSYQIPFPKLIAWCAKVILFQISCYSDILCPQRTSCSKFKKPWMTFAAHHVDTRILYCMSRYLLFSHRGPPCAHFHALFFLLDY